MSKQAKDIDISDDADDDVESVYEDADIDEDIDVDVDVDVEESKNIKDDDDEEDDEDEDKEVPKKRVHVYHQVPESTEIKIVPAHRRVTSEYMTTFEYAMIVGTRATHISEGSVLYTDPQGLYDPRDIAKKEMAENKCPLSITRKVSPTMIEIWEVNEMVKPQM